VKLELRNMRGVWQQCWLAKPASTVGSRFVGLAILPGLHIISLGHARESVQAIVERFRSQNIVCGTRGGRIRISLAPYNDESDLNALIEAFAGAGS
jgi:selenocysteine lyase/cysteine desulfurase